MKYDRCSLEGLVFNCTKYLLTLLMQVNNLTIDPKRNFGKRTECRDVGSERIA